MQDFLKDNLGSDFVKIKNKWEDFKNGKIAKKELITDAVKIVGKKFIKIFMQRI